MQMLLDHPRTGFISELVPQEQAEAIFADFWTDGHLKIITVHGEENAEVRGEKGRLCWNRRPCKCPEHLPDHPALLPCDISVAQWGALIADWCKFQGINSEAELIAAIQLKSNDTAGTYELFRNFVTSFRPHTQKVYGCLESTQHLYPTNYVSLS